MRQFVALILSVGSLAIFAQTPPDSSETIANKQIELANQELQRITDLVQAGALPRVRLEQAQKNVEDAKDEAILERTLYGDLQVEKVNDQMMDDMVAAAQRRLERQQTKLVEATKLVANGITPQSSLT